MKSTYLMLAVACAGCISPDPTPKTPADPVVITADGGDDESDVRFGRDAEPDVLVIADAEPPSPDLARPPDMEVEPELPPIPYELEELPANATAPWPGGVVHGALVEISHVIDGDTVHLATTASFADQPRLRIQGLNAPECDKTRGSNGGLHCDPSSQDFAGEAEFFGVEAWEGLADLLEGREVRIACLEVDGECEKDRYDRYLGFVVVDGVDATEWMIANGLAWTYTSFPVPNLYTYCVAEELAIADGLGMWEVGFDEVILRMNASTRNWYVNHDSTCARYAP